MGEHVWWKMKMSNGSDHTVPVFDAHISFSGILSQLIYFTVNRNKTTKPKWATYRRLLGWQIIHFEIRHLYKSRWNVPSFWIPTCWVCFQTVWWILCLPLEGMSDLVPSKGVTSVESNDDVADIAPHIYHHSIVSCFIVKNVMSIKIHIYEWESQYTCNTLNIDFITEMCYVCKTPHTEQFSVQIHLDKLTTMDHFIIKINTLTILVPLKYIQ